MLSCRVHRARCKVASPLVSQHQTTWHNTTYNGKLIRFNSIAKSKEPRPGSEHGFFLPVGLTVA